MTNVVLLVMDTARYDSVLGTQTNLPTFDTLQNQGVTYTSAFANAPWTLPSHGGLFSGQYSSKHGASAAAKRFPEHTPTIVEAFKNASYETVAISNNTWISDEFGFARGFDTFRKNWQYIQSDVDLGKIAREEEGFDKIRGVAKQLFDGNPIVNAANAVYGQFVRKRADDDGAKSTNRWISDWLDDRDDSDPFFLFINYLEPHLEYRPPREFAEEYLPEGVSYAEAMEVNQDAWSYIANDVEMTDRDFEILEALYHAEIAYLDERIGELRRLLEEAGEWEDTIFVVTGDHGENIGDHGLMDHQYSLHDTLIHVPLVIHGGAFTGGKTVDDIVQLTDIAPTLLDAAGIDTDEFVEESQGRSFHPDAETEPREYAFAEYLAPQPSMEALAKRVSDLPEEVYEYDRSLRAIRSKNWKLIRGSDGSIELYHVADDPGELENLASERSEKVSELESELDAWLGSFEHADATGDADMSDSTKDRLEDLGYLQ
ncbi:sulfatase [Halorubrum ezzemoulense]|uniref:sulfatase family protein n=1 Tax=Halorubrum TaxID=56688 RepID=UPI0018EE5AFC|nr:MULTISPECIES: sulfatase [Halorubrum]MDB2253506.1 sulfatase [Halorubrum ezzemoulense]